MGGAVYLPDINTKIYLNSNQHYAELGTVSDLESTLAKHHRRIARKANRASRSNQIGGVTVGYKSDADSYFATAYQRVNGIPRYHRERIRAHEQIHLADLTGNLDKVEESLDVKLQGYDSEMRADLGSLFALGKKYDVKRLLISKKNPRGIFISDSSGPVEPYYQVKYHMKVVKEYNKQKNSKKKSKSSRRSKGKSSKK